MLHLTGYQVIYPNSLPICYPAIHVERGEFVGLFGPSGCGKTSLLDSLFSSNFSGKVQYHEALLNQEPFPKRKSELYSFVSYCPQFSQAALNPKLTINEHIQLMLADNHIKSDSLNIKAMLGNMKLTEDLLQRRPGGLSGGQQQRMVLLLCALKKPKFMVLDEPSSGIDLITQKEMVSFLHGLKDECTILMVAHSYNLLEHVCERIIEL